MKQSFLQYVAADILEKYSGRLHRVAIVFPNKRASLFLNQYLYQMVGHTMLGPNYFTISDLIDFGRPDTISMPIIPLLHQPDQDLGIT